MKRIAVVLSMIVVSTTAIADVTLKCEANTRCDGYLKNCTVDPYSFSVNIDPKNGRVTVGSKQIKADFSNAAEVSFAFTDYQVHINKFEYSVVLIRDNEVRHGWCAKVEPAW